MNFPMIEIFTNHATWRQRFVELAAMHAPQTVGLSGGSAAQLYSALHTELGDSAEYWLCDERFVAADDTDSNQRLIVTTGCAPLQAWRTDLLLTDCVADYAARLPQALDVVILGVGNDGHFASVFPDDVSIWQATAAAAATTTTQWAVTQRLTLAPQYLAQARQIIVLLAGAGKQGIVDELRQPTRSRTEFPAHWLTEQGDSVRVLWLQD